MILGSPFTYHSRVSPARVTMAIAECNTMLRVEEGLSLASDSRMGLVHCVRKDRVAEVRGSWSHR